MGSGGGGGPRPLGSILCFLARRLHLSRRLWGVLRDPHASLSGRHSFKGRSGGAVADGSSPRSSRPGLWRTSSNPGPRSLCVAQKASARGAEAGVSYCPAATPSPAHGRCHSQCPERGRPPSEKYLARGLTPVKALPSLSPVGGAFSAPECPVWGPAGPSQAGSLLDPPPSWTPHPVGPTRLGSCSLSLDGAGFSAMRGPWGEEDGETPGGGGWAEHRGPSTGHRASTALVQLRT